MLTPIHNASGGNRTHTGRPKCPLPPFAYKLRSTKILRSDHSILHGRAKNVCGLEIVSPCATGMRVLCFVHIHRQPSDY